MSQRQDRKEWERLQRSAPDVANNAMTRYLELAGRIADPDNISQVTTRPWETGDKLYPTTHQPIWQMCLRNAQGSSSDYPFAGDEIRVRQALANLLREHGRLEPATPAPPSEDVLSKAWRLEVNEDAVGSGIEALGDDRLRPLRGYHTEPETGHYATAARKLRLAFEAIAGQVGRQDRLPLPASPNHVESGTMIVEAYSDITGMSPDAVRRHLEQHLGELQTLDAQAEGGHGSSSSVDRIVDHATWDLWTKAIDHQIGLDRSGAEQTAEPAADPMRVALGDLPNPGAKAPADARASGGGEQDRPGTIGQRPEGLTRS